MKKGTYALILGFLVQIAMAQNPFNCSSHIMYQRQLDNNPVFRKNQQQLEEETKNFIENKSAARPAAAPYILPVVFHVIYTTAAGNISDAQIIDQVAILNKEFPRLQSDTVLTPAAFKAAAAGLNVEFRLATIDPNGNCTNGIDRVYSTLSNCSFAEDDIKALSVWPSNKYLNIWLVQSMHYSGSLDCSGGGYATFPGGAANIDGINIRGDLISNIGTAATNSGWGNFKGRYLVHELGHWFNLRHIWGDQNCGNDLVSDTPPAVTSNSGCPNFPHNPSNSCGGNANGEMYTDYMDYTDGTCLNMFTAGQVARMTAAITSTVSGRSNLWSNSNLNATGTNNPYTYPVACVASPALLPYGTLVVCKGDSVKLVDNSYGGNSTSRAWSFPGGSASSLTDSVVKVQYNTAGIYPVVLTKNYLSTSKTETFVNKIQVLDDVPNTNYGFPFSEDFENQSSFNSDWVIVNNDNDQTTWEMVSTTAYSGASCVSINNFGKSAPLTDDLISPAYDLSSVLSPTLTFRLHFANRITANYDRLLVYISNNCTKTWQQIYTRTASSSSSLNTVPGNIAGSYIPDFGSDDDWRREKVNIINSWAGAVVRFKFSFISGGGNNIFIDDINIDGLNATGVAKNQNTSGIKIFPNPTKDNLQITFNTRGKIGSQIEIVDVVGKICLSQSMDIGSENKTTIDVRSLKDGVYFIRLKQTDGTIYNSKFIKQSSN